MSKVATNINLKLPLTLKIFTCLHQPVGNFGHRDLSFDFWKNSRKFFFLTCYARQKNISACISGKIDQKYTLLAYLK